MPVKVAPPPTAAPPPKALLDVGREAADVATFLRTTSVKSLGRERPAGASYLEVPLAWARPGIRSALSGLRSALDVDPAHQIVVAEGKGGALYVKTYRDASSVFTDPSERFGAVEDVRWYELKPKAPKAAPGAAPAPAASSALPPSDVAGEAPAASGRRKPSVAERAAVLNAYGQKVLEKALARGAFSEHIPLPKPGQERRFWEGLLAAEANRKEGVTELDRYVFSMCCAVFSKNGEPDLEKAAEKTELLKALLLAEARRQTSPDARNPEAINDELSRRVAASHHRGPRSPTSIADPRFLGELAALTGRRPLRAPEPEQLKDNVEAARARLKQVASARHDVNCAVWKIYDDESGRAFAAALAQAARKGRQVRLVVDGNVAARDPGATRILDELEAAGVQVLRFRDTRRLEALSHGMHAKLLLTDVSAEARAARGYTPERSVLLEGGRNAGAPYLTAMRAPSDPGFGWSDSEHRFTGSGAVASYQAFADIWNEGLAATEHPRLAPIVDRPGRAELDALAAREKGRKIDLLNLVDLPGPKNDQEITAAIVKCIDGLGKGDRLTAGQAYFLKVPAIEAAYERFLDRGGLLDVYTNGARSNDVPLLDVASRDALERLAAHARPGQLRVFEKTGVQTMHDKVMIFESKRHPEASFVLAMSFNQHLRSQLFEVEVGKWMRGPGVVEQALANMRSIPVSRNPRPSTTALDRLLMPLTVAARAHL